MKFNEIQTLCIVLLFYLISNQSIPIINFSKNSYGGLKIFVYEPEPIISPQYEGDGFFFLSFSESFFTYLYIYEGDSEEYYFIEIDDENEFYQYKIKKNNLTKIYFQNRFYMERDIILYR